MKQNLRQFLKKALVIARNILAIGAAICLGVALTFLLTGRFTFLAYSERLLFTGIIVIILGGLVGFAIMFSGKSIGIPTMIRRPAEAKKMLDHFTEFREEIEKRYDASITIWLIGIFCVLVSALVERLLA